MISVKVTLLYAAVFAILNMWIASRAGRIRISDDISIGDGGNELLRTRMRSHANFIEYVPIALILMALIEIQGGDARGLWVAGGLLTASRIAHVFGMERPIPNPYRYGGILVTYIVSSALIIWGLYLVYAPAISAVNPRFA